MKDLVGATINKSNDKKSSEIFEFSQDQQQQIDTLLEGDDGIGGNANNLLNYIREAIKAREYGKFVFTRSISTMLELIVEFGRQHGLSREEMSHIPIDNLLNLVKFSSDINAEEHLREISEKEKEKHDVSVAVRLPQLLTEPDGVYVIPFQVSHPNFITRKKIVAPCVVLSSKIDVPALEEKIVLIEGADPGFDWIFSQKIAGLVTKYGGVNSHMAIRCAEFGIPAAIGCGEQRFDMLLKSSHAHLDCSSGLINPTH
jgi:phosphohistidine swiveling domain-containing protein